MNIPGNRENLNNNCFWELKGLSEINNTYSRISSNVLGAWKEAEGRQDRWGTLCQLRLRNDEGWE